MTTPLRGHAGPSRSWEYIRSRWASRQIYVGIGAIAGTANIVLNTGKYGAPHPIDLAFMVVALVLVTLLPLRPSWGMVAYLASWLFLLGLPHPFASDMFLTHLAVFFFAGRFLPPWYAGAALLILLGTDFLALQRGVATSAAAVSEAGGVAFHVIIGLLLVPTGGMIRSSEQNRLTQAQQAEERLEELRMQISREMHDLIAYSMSQTALRAQRAAADTTYPAAARKEFAALETTAADALHELRLLLRTLRRAAPELAPDVTQGVGTSNVVTDLGAAVRAVSDDIAAAGFDVTYRCRGNISPTRSQASTLSRVAREMGANVVRHAEPNAPVTLTLRLGPEVIRLVSTNRIRVAPGDLPRSGSGVLGMRERLTAIGGELTTLTDDGSWIVTATVPVSGTRALAPGDES